MVEDYVTLIWKAYEWPGSEPATTDLAASLGVTPSTVSANLKKLARDGLITYEPYGRIELTETGAEIAVAVVRRHRIIETYLVERLGLSWDQVHDEADRLEHAVSDLVLERMDAELGRPSVDPHGDPIPSPSGQTASVDSWSLAEAPAGRDLRVLRVSDREPQVLRYLDAKGVRIGTVVSVSARSAAAGVVALRAGADELEISLTSALAVRVESAPA
jgi:DtxR family transcriptional regulator, Mn-dependent transcriptional regulator